MNKFPPSHRYGFETDKSALRFEAQTDSTGVAREIAYQIQTINISNIDPRQLAKITARLRKIEKEVRQMVKIINDRNAISQARIDNNVRGIVMDPFEVKMLQQSKNLMANSNIRNPKRIDSETPLKVHDADIPIDSVTSS